MPKEIADAFGVPHDSLVPIKDDELVGHVGHCESCIDWERKYAVLAAELAESRREVERCHKLVEELLLRLPPTSHA